MPELDAIRSLRRTRCGYALSCDEADEASRPRCVAPSADERGELTAEPEETTGLGRGQAANRAAAASSWLSRRKAVPADRSMPTVNSPRPRANVPGWQREQMI